MNKPEFVSAIVERTGFMRKDAEMALNVFTDIITQELAKGGKVQFVGFGTFEVVDRAKRMGHNPQTGEKMEIAGSKLPRFKAGQTLKDAVNGRGA